MALNDTRVHPENELPSIINLNIGGSLFTTRLSTLQSVPGSMLATMFSGRHSLDKDDQGRYFIDRDGKHFNHILAYLRDPANLSVPVDAIPEVLEEARYYQLSTLIELLKDHPSLLAYRIVKTYRSSLGDKYETMKSEVISSLSRKSPIDLMSLSITRPVQLDAQPFPPTTTDGEANHASGVNSVYQPATRSPHTTLKTDIRIATPHVSFDKTDPSCGANMLLPASTQSVLRRNHQRPYNPCQADGHDFKDIDVVSSFWHKSDIWSLLLYDLRHELNTRVEVKIEQGTPIYCTRCRFQNSYGVCIYSIFWLRGDIPAKGSESTILLNSCQEPAP